MAYMHATGRYSMPQIARALHLKDHTTILHGLRRAHGHDGKPSKRKNQIEPLWKKDQFVNMVRADFPELFAEEADWSFTNGEGWAA
jgi:SRSO17 transposase